MTKKTNRNTSRKTNHKTKRNTSRKTYYKTKRNKGRKTKRNKGRKTKHHRGGAAVLAITAAAVPAYFMNRSQLMYYYTCWNDIIQNMENIFNPDMEGGMNYFLNKIKKRRETIPQGPILQAPETQGPILQGPETQEPGPQEDLINGGNYHKQKTFGNKLKEAIKGNLSPSGIKLLILVGHKNVLNALNLNRISEESLKDKGNEGNDINEENIDISHIKKITHRETLSFDQPLSNILIRINDLNDLTSREIIPLEIKNFNYNDLFVFKEDFEYDTPDTHNVSVSVTPDTHNVSVSVTPDTQNVSVSVTPTDSFKYILFIRDSDFDLKKTAANKILPETFNDGIYPLSPEGRLYSVNFGRLILPKILYKINIELVNVKICSSPLLRAMETSKLISLGLNESYEKQSIESNDIDIIPYLSELEDFDRIQTVAFTRWLTFSPVLNMMQNKIAKFLTILGFIVLAIIGIKSGAIFAIPLKFLLAKIGPLKPILNPLLTPSNIAVMSSLSSKSLLTWLTFISLYSTPFAVLISYLRPNKNCEKITMGYKKDKLRNIQGFNLKYNNDIKKIYMATEGKNITSKNGCNIFIKILNDFYGGFNINKLNLPNKSQFDYFRFSGDLTWNIIKPSKKTPQNVVKVASQAPKNVVKVASQAFRSMMYNGGGDEPQAHGVNLNKPFQEFELLFNYKTHSLLHNSLDLWRKSLKIIIKNHRNSVNPLNAILKEIGYPWNHNLGPTEVNNIVNTFVNTFVHKYGQKPINEVDLETSLNDNENFKAYKFSLERNKGAINKSEVLPILEQRCIIFTHPLLTIDNNNKEYKNQFEQFNHYSRCFFVKNYLNEKHLLVTNTSAEELKLGPFELGRKNRSVLYNEHYGTLKTDISKTDMSEFPNVIHGSVNINVKNLNKVMKRLIDNFGKKINSSNYLYEFTVGPDQGGGGTDIRIKDSSIEIILLKNKGILDINLVLKNKPNSYHYKNGKIYFYNDKPQNQTPDNFYYLLQNSNKLVILDKLLKMSSIQFLYKNMPGNKYTISLNEDNNMNSDNLDDILTHELISQRNQRIQRGTN